MVANHQSLLDILLLSKLPREMKWIAKESLFKVPWVGWIFRISGDISVRRGDSESGGAALAKARRYLERGMSVMIFPEGTRSVSAKLLPFKSGAFRPPIEAGVPILPVAVHGTASGMPKGNPWVRPCRAYARILEPIPTEGLRLEDTGMLKGEVRRRIAAALPARTSRAKRWRRGRSRWPRGAARALYCARRSPQDGGPPLRRRRHAHRDPRVVPAAFVVRESPSGRVGRSRRSRRRT